MRNLLTFCFLVILNAWVLAGEHPNLVVNRDDVKSVKQNWQKYSLLKSSYLEVKNNVDKFLAVDVDVPLPKDAAGYTHETHKRNYTLMYQAGLMYAFTGEKQYAEFVKKLLLKYADLYPKLGKHPAAASESAGRLFWQSLNEAVWLFYTSQAYDCVYDALGKQERETIEKNVLGLIAKYFTEEREEEFNRIHNHGTWSCAAVGMAGLAMGDKELVEKALLGTEKDGKAGFIKQIELLFSPDGYYTEGAYYTRYALLPFFAFAVAIENNLPERKIFQFRNQIYKKALYAALQQTSASGDFIPLNDAMKAKNHLSPEIVFALDVTFEKYGKDKSLLAVAQKQGKVILSSAGVEVAKAIEQSKLLAPFPYESVVYTDGANGDEGGITILRSGTEEPQEMVVFKYGAHGLSHGHYDKLSLMYYDQGKEILQDYGSARFINVDPKYGGRYLPENKSYAMQTVAHNTLVVDEQSHYQGKIALSEQYHPDFHFASLKGSDIQIVSAKDTTAYKGVAMQRTLIMVNDKRFLQPPVIDIVKAVSAKEHKYDLPYYYLGHLINTNVKYTPFGSTQTALGKSNGYQHLWKEAEGKPVNGLFQFSWVNKERFYSITSAVDSSSNILFTRIGANDPNFNLRHDAGVMISGRGANFTAASAIEPHGMYDEVREYTSDVYGQIEKVTILQSSADYTVVRVTGKEQINWLFIINNGTADEKKQHSLAVEGKTITWTGNYYFSN